jgi:carboxylesterase
LLITIAKAYVESNLTWAEVEEIGDRMAQGKTFNTVISELNLTERVSPDMLTMMTLVDKKAIVLARNSRQRRE